MDGKELYRYAKTKIPGGTQLLSKRPELYLPEQWPAYYRRAKGVEVETLDGRTYIDMCMMGVGACILGYADEDVDEAVCRAIRQGVQCTLNVPEEVELAQVLCELHPWAGMVRYARSGGEAMALAVRIGRAKSGKDGIAFCGYHGWMDWYLAANLSSEDALEDSLMPGLPPVGVPQGLQGSAWPFRYNCLEELEAIVAAHGEKLGVIVMEPQRSSQPAPGFLEAVRRIADQVGAVLIFDEITTGFRMTCGGIHLLYDVTPDMAVFAKAISNGYAMAAVIGTEPVMQAAQDSFISSTNWTERIGPVAALATIHKHQEQEVAAYIRRIGELVSQGWREAAQEAGLPLHVDGFDSLTHFGIDHPDELTLSTLFTQEMLERGYLAYPQFKPSLAHTQAHVEVYLQEVRTVFGILAQAAERQDAAARLKGPVARRGFYRLA